MRITVRTELEAPAAVIWQTVKTPDAFVYVARGMLRFPASERFDRPLEVGHHIQGWTFLFGVVPFSYHHLTIESIDENHRVLVSSEHGGLIKSWRHQLTTTPIDDTTCRYEDLIDIDAGMFTPIVAAFTALFFRHRQRRWRAIAPLLAASARPTSQNEPSAGELSP